METPCSPTCGCAATSQRPVLDLAAVRAKLAASVGGGKKYWRSLEAVAEAPEFHEWLHREYPRGASEWPEGRSRRDFLKLMAASFVLAGVTACTRQPQEKILPYVKQPEQLIPGIPLQYATAMTIGGYATGLLVESHEVRPTKIEGNPDHPMSPGTANVFHQASILELYDPERTRTVLRAGEVSTQLTSASNLGDTDFGPPPAKNYLNEEITVRSWLLTTDHKRIGLLYLFTILIFLRLRVAPPRSCARSCLPRRATSCCRRPIINYSPFIAF